MAVPIAASQLSVDGLEQLARMAALADRQELLVAGLLQSVDVPDRLLEIAVLPAREDVLDLLVLLPQISDHLVDHSLEAVASRALDGLQHRLWRNFVAKSVSNLTCQTEDST